MDEGEFIVMLNKSNYFIPTLWISQPYLSSKFY